MTPLPTRPLLAVVVALGLAAAAGAQTPAGGQTWNDFYGPGAGGPIVETPSRGTAATARVETPLWEKALLARSRAMNEYYGLGSRKRDRSAGDEHASADLSTYGWGAAATAAKRHDSPQAAGGRRVTGGEPIVTHERGYPTYRAAAPQPDWPKALNARSQAMNERYGAGASTAVRPDDRGTPRPAASGVLALAGTDDGIAWGDVTVGALGGFGIALLLGLGGYAAVHAHRRTSTVAR